MDKAVAEECTIQTHMIAIFHYEIIQGALLCH
jgi:hypothetical protein